MRQILAGALVALLLAAVPNATPADPSEERHAFEFHNAPLAGAIALIGAEFHRKLIADGSVPNVKGPDRLPPVTFAEAIQIVKSYGLEFKTFGIGKDQVIVFSANDTAVRDGGVVYDRSLQYATADDHLVEFLTKSLPAGTQVLAVAGSRRLIVTGSQAAVSRAKDLLDKIDVTTFGLASDASVTRIAERYRAEYANPSDLVKSLNLSQAELGEGTVSIDDRTKTIVLYGSRAFVASTRARIALLDVQSQQGRFDVEIVSLTDTSTNDLGFQWAGRDLSNAVTTGKTSTAFTSRTLPLTVTISDLVQRGKAKIIAKTQLFASNNQQFDLKAGERYPIPVPDPLTGIPTVQQEDIGVIVNLTPTFSDDFVRLKLHLEESELIGLVNNIYPRISQDVYNAPSIRLAYDETLVLAGLLKNTSSETVQRVGGLDKIPLIGMFFRYKLTSSEQDQLVFLFTPHRDTLDHEFRPPGTVVPSPAPGTNPLTGVPIKSGTP